MHGQELYSWCAKPVNQSTLKPELQAEIKVGMEVSKGISWTELDRLLTEFMSQGEEWQKANSWILSETAKTVRKDDPVSQTLRKTVASEVKWTYSVWQGDFAHAYELALGIADKMDAEPDLKPYRTFWTYCAACCAFAELDATKNHDWRDRYKASIRKAADSVLAISWFAALKRLLETDSSGSALAPPVVDAARIANLLDQWHLNGPRFEEEIGKATVLIRSDVAEKFEQGIEILGAMLGAETFRWNPGKDKGAPDGLWILANGRSVIWEAKSDVDASSPITMEQSRQAAGHEAWIKGWREEIDLRDAITVYATHQVSIREEALKHGATLHFLPISDLRQLFAKVAATLLSVRNQCRALSDERRLDVIVAAYREAGCGNDELARFLSSQRLIDLPRAKAG